jgi:predicted dehydrogenase
VATLNIGIVGVGHMGRLHAAKVTALREAGADVALAGIHDLDGDRARQVAGALGVPAMDDAETLFRECQAVVVAVPTVAHHAVVRTALEAGLDVLVEKPIAHSVSEAEDLLAVAEARQRVLQVGHLEWFNAASRVIRSHVRAPRFVEVRRLGPFPARATDVDVVRDLMIHDIDILQQVLGDEPTRIEALGVPVITDKVDIANVRVEFPSGCIADMVASRVSRSPVRKMRFFQRDGFFSIDFARQSASIYRRVVNGNEAWPSVEKEKVRFEPEDALLTQLRAFVDGVKKRDDPLATARTGLGALRTALRVVEAIPSVDEIV